MVKLYLYFLTGEPELGLIEVYAHEGLDSYIFVEPVKLLGNATVLKKENLGVVYGGVVVLNEPNSKKAYDIFKLNRLHSQNTETLKELSAVKKNVDSVNEKLARVAKGFGKYIGE